MKRVLALLLLAFAGAASAAGPALKVNFVVTSAAASEFVNTHGTNATAQIVDQMSNFTAALSHLGCGGGNPTVTYSISTTSFPELTTLGSAELAAVRYNVNSDVATQRDATGADMTVVIVSGSSMGGTVIPGQIPATVHGAIAVIDVGKIMSANVVVAHELGHLLGARHWDDPNTGNAHGWYIREGGYTTTKTCVQDVMTYANPIPTSGPMSSEIPLSSCAGWGNLYATYPVSGGFIPFTCNPQDYCNMYVQERIAAGAIPSGYAAPYTGELWNSGVYRICMIMGYYGTPGVKTHTGIYTSVTDPGTVSSRGMAQPGIPCSPDRVPRYSNPSDNWNGYALGTSTANNAAAVCANAAAVSNFHNTPHRPWTESIDWATGGGGLFLR